MSSQTHAKAHQLRQHKRAEFSKDGVEQQVSFFSSEQSPVSWGLVLDRSGSMMGMMKDVYEGALHV